MRVERRFERGQTAVDTNAGRLVRALARLISDADRDLNKGRERLAGLSLRLDGAPAKRLADLSLRLEALDRTRMTLGYGETLKRGYAVVRGDGAVVTTRASAEKATVLEVQFHDGRLTLGPRPARKGKGGEAPDQGSLF